MRKLRRSVIRHMAEKENAKTIKLFRYLWKRSRETPGNITVTGGKKVKMRSMSRRLLGV